MTLPIIFNPRYTAPSGSNDGSVAIVHDITPLPEQLDVQSTLEDAIWAARTLFSILEEIEDIADAMTYVGGEVSLLIFDVGCIISQLKALNR